MAEVFDSELNPLPSVQEPPVTVSEPLVTTNSQRETIFKNSSCSLLQEKEEEKISLEKVEKGVSEISEMEKKKENLVDFCGDDVEGSTKCSLTIEVIDDTALIGPAKLTEIALRNGKAVTVVGSADHFPRNGNNKRNMVQGSDAMGKRITGFEGKSERNVNDTRNWMQESDGNGKRFASSEDFEGKKKEKRSRRRQKKNDAKKQIDEKENVGSDNIQVVNVSREGKICYSRNEMEALRYSVDMEDQKNKWVEVYCGIGAEIAKEYDSLVISDIQNQKNISLDFDPRRQFGYQRSPSMIGCSENSEIDDEDNYNSDEEEYDSILKPAFTVVGEPDFDSGPALDGFEYLRRVRWEASRFPKVKVSKVDKSKLMKEQSVYMPQIPDIANCPQHLLPLKQWEDAFLTDFSNLRLALSRHEGLTEKVACKEPILSPKLSDTIVVESFEELIVGEDDDTLESTQITQQNDISDLLESYVHEQPMKENTENYPTLSMILEMDSVTRVSKLRKRINSFESVTKDDCLWLFALCAAVDTPLDADTCASFRTLLRKCASLRAQKTQLDDEVIMLNILATISGKYFGQSEK